jgi:hypothetical protein
MSNRIPCPKCKSQAGEEVAPTSVWEHLVPTNVEIHEYECQRCGNLWVIEREKSAPAAQSEE